MKRGDHFFFKQKMVGDMFGANHQFYQDVYDRNYPIERLVSRPNRNHGDVVKTLAFGILGNPEKVILLSNKYHFGWRQRFHKSDE